jgi:uncharacterized membrane-anchored protein
MLPKPNSSDQPEPCEMAAVKKLPEVTALFWIIKLLTTGMGETTSDYFVHQMSPMIALGLEGGGLLVALILQFAARKYIPWIYWLAMSMVAIFGTIAADIIHVGLGISYLASTVGLSILLGTVFTVWYISEKTLSIDRIYTPRRELFYWATVIVTFALGTATGDMTASTLGLGYFTSGLLFTMLFVPPMIAYWRSGLNEVGAFWLAYILTRPLGASFADWIGKPHSHNGAGFGTGRISLVLAILIASLVAYLTYSHKDRKRAW